MDFVGRLPPELWSNIFLDCLPFHPSFAALKAPLLLTHVCRHWRDVALSTPTLWSNISLTGGIESITDTTLIRFDMWLERSRSCPLSIDLPTITDYACCIRDADKLDIVCGIILHLAANGHRLKRLLRIGSQYVTNSDTLQLSAMPWLEELHLCDFSVTRSNRSQDFPITRLPENLRTLTLQGMPLHLTTLPSMPRLCHLDLLESDVPEHMSTQKCLSVLAQLPTLETCGLSLFHDQYIPEYTRLHPVVLPRLRCLVLDGFGPKIGPFMDHVRTPMLSSLGINGCFAGCWPYVGRFLIEQREALSTLAFGKVGAINGGLAQALRHCRSSTQIVLCSGHLGSHMMATMIDLRPGERRMMTSRNFEVWAQDLKSIENSTSLASALQHEQVLLRVCKGVSAEHKSSLETRLAAEKSD
ncbi:hypothetical protein BD410DRAFT_606722 [Rickenella mellea]|uniref:Uncharacterized protein n=1 Tax=Rickenella mellea TaxID=50990 RepID=A0A4Y7QDR1_9AGAM|nr:hypothetical protein BD410DRAFT_606722 [Rickenella mellea]